MTALERGLLTSYESAVSLARRDHAARQRRIFVRREALFRLVAAEREQAVRTAWAEHAGGPGYAVAFEAIMEWTAETACLIARQAEEASARDDAEWGSVVLPALSRLETAVYGSPVIWRRTG